MEGETRRLNIVQLLSTSDKPMSGTELAKAFGVSRQVIVQDIALLRAIDKNILSTNKGYVLYDPKAGLRSAKRSFSVCHEDAQIADELYTIVDYGGTVLDVVIEHEVYGQITADLFLKKRIDVDEFVKKLQSNQAKPLNLLTGGNHVHTVEAEDEATLDAIAEALKKKGYLNIF